MDRPDRVRLVRSPLHRYLRFPIGLEAAAGTKLESPPGTVASGHRQPRRRRRRRYPASTNAGLDPPHTSDVLLASGETKAAEHEVEARGHGRPSPADRAKEARLERDEKARAAIKAGPLICHCSASRAAVDEIAGAWRCSSSSGARRSASSRRWCCSPPSTRPAPAFRFAVAEVLWEASLGIYRLVKGCKTLRECETRRGGVAERRPAATTPQPPGNAAV